MSRFHRHALAPLALLCALASAAPAARPQWANPGGAALPVNMPDPPKDPMVVELGRSGKPYRVLPFTRSGSSLRFTVPPRATVQVWPREDMAKEETSALATAARWGAFPTIAVGTVVVTPGSGEEFAWQSAPGRFRAYPEAGIPVRVTVKNQGVRAWAQPRIRLFAPDTWRVTPDVAEVQSQALKAPHPNAKKASETARGLLPGDTGVATFVIRIPRMETLRSTAPLVAFMRFNAGGKTMTVQNSVDVTLDEPIERRYAMNEAGTRFFVRMINRFAPTPLGQPQVEVRSPAGVAWTVTPPAPVTVRQDVDAVASLDMRAVPDDQVGVPVVVTLNGLRMGQTPVVHGVAVFGAGPDSQPAATEKGLKRLAADPPADLTTDGACLRATTGERAMPLDVADRFAVSDPNQFVSPTWVIVTLKNTDGQRIRLEYDAWDADKPTVAGDLLLTPSTENTLTFLLPDARFQGRLPGQADLRLVLSGGTACIQRISVSKWNPAREG